MIPPAVPARAACPPGIGRAASRIVIVGDDPAICSFIGRVLAAAGYVTDVAGTGTEGLRPVAEPGYELVIVDLLAADLGGPRARGRLQVREETQPRAEVVRVGQLSLDLATFPGRRHVSACAPQQRRQRWPRRSGSRCRVRSPCRSR